MLVIQHSKEFCFKKVQISVTRCSGGG